MDPKKILRILGPNAAQQNIVEEVHNVYRSQGVDIHDKHIEVIVHQMIRRDIVTDSGDSDMLLGELVDHAHFREINRSLVMSGKKPAQARPELLGITKASLATESWLSAASFQETTRVLTEAALDQKVDDLKGLKENVIIGKLIPAGTGLARYRNAKVEPDKAIRDTIFPNFGLDESQDDDLGKMSDEELAQMDMSNIDFGDLTIGDDFNPDDHSFDGDDSTSGVQALDLSAGDGDQDETELNLGDIAGGADGAADTGDVDSQEVADAQDDSSADDGFQINNGEDTPLPGDDEANGDGADDANQE